MATTRSLVRKHGIQTGSQQREKTAPRDERFFSDLGLFVLLFAQAESLLWSAIWATSGMELKAAQALLSGIRVNDGIGLLGRLLDVQEPIVKAKKEVKEALRQLGIINKVRNDILHYGIDLNRKEKIITNQMKALSRSRITRTKISSSVIAFMVSDVAVILEVLAQQIVGNSHLDIVDVIC